MSASDITSYIQEAGLENRRLSASSIWRSFRHAGVKIPKSRVEDTLSNARNSLPTLTPVMSRTVIRQFIGAALDDGMPDNEIIDAFLSHPVDISKANLKTLIKGVKDREP